MIQRPRIIRIECRARGRAAFTMIELMVAVSILLILAALTFAIYGGGRASDKTRSAARIAQSAFLGAKDRALHAKDFRGVRLTRLGSDPVNFPAEFNLVSGFVFLQQLPNQVYGVTFPAIQLERFYSGASGTNINGGPLSDSPEVLIVRGFDGNEKSPPTNVLNFEQVDWATLYNPGSSSFAFLPSPGRIRIPAGSGQWFNFVVSQRSGYVLGSGNEVLELLTPFPQSSVPYKSNAASGDVVALPLTSKFTSCEIQMGAGSLPFHQPILLPAGNVIDLNFSSQSVKTLANNSPNSNVDMMFSPRGMLAGDIVSRGVLNFVIRDVADAIKQLDPSSPAVQGEILILSVFPQTGLVQTFEADITDAVSNITGNPPGDGFADNLFRFVQQGRAAGQ